MQYFVTGATGFIGGIVVGLNAFAIIVVVGASTISIAVLLTGPATGF